MTKRVRSFLATLGFVGAPKESKVRTIYLILSVLQIAQLKAS